MPALLARSLPWLLCAAGAAGADEPRSSRGHASANAEYVIVLRDEGSGKCRVEVTRDTEPAWTLPRCVGTVDDLYFISDSGQRFWVLATLPKSVPAPPERPVSATTRARAAVRTTTTKKPVHDAYASVTVAVLYDRLGNVLGERKLRDFVPRAAYRKLRPFDRRFAWLEGVAGIPGREPRVPDGNQVEFETVEPRTFRLGFEE